MTKPVASSRERKSAPSIAVANRCSLIQFVTIWSLRENFGKPPRMHCEMCDWLEKSDGDPHRLMLAYRHAAKSTIVCLYVCWSLARDPNTTFLIVSGSAELATTNSEFIRSVIESHPLCKHLVPDRGTERWQTTKFNVVRATKRRDYSVSIKSVGSRLTGAHADTLIGDDIEIAENANTAEGRAKISSTVDKMFSIGSRMIFLGTPHDTITIYERLANGVIPFLTRKWPVLKMDGSPQAADFLQNGVAHDAAWIRTKELGVSGQYASQYLLIPSKAYATLIDIELIHAFDATIRVDEFDRDERSFRASTPSFWIDGKRIRDLRAYMDVASGLTGRDKSVVSIAAKTEQNDVYLLACTTLPAVDLDADQPWRNAMAAVLDVCGKYHCNAIHVEENGLGFTLAAELRGYARSKGKKLRIKESDRRTNKKEFIANQIEPLIKIGRLYVDSMILDDSRHPFNIELAGFPNGKHDDHIDSFAGALNELSPSHASADKADKWLSELPFVKDRKPAVLNDFR